MSPLGNVLKTVDRTLPQALERLMALLRIPSISTDPAYKNDCREAANYMVDLLREVGFTASRRDTPGHPMVVAHYTPPVSSPGAGGPHLLFYGHYDVQPVDPLDLWDRDPFDPQLEETPKGKVIRGRGSSDDKGQLMTFIEACIAWKHVQGDLPCKITIFLEGEEESGSSSLVPFMQDNADELRADIALICDTGLFADKTPGIVTMLRGLVGEEITLCGPNKDLHSGMYGGIAVNPVHVLAKILGNMHDEQGRVRIPGFYDGVQPLPSDIAAQWRALHFDHTAFLGKVGLSHPAAEQNHTALEMIWSRPTAEVNGITGGYTGNGFKTVLPAKASAKVSFRLVGRQDPQAIRTHFRTWVESQLPVDCTVTFSEHGASEAVTIDPQNPAFQAARAALSEEWATEAAYIGCGGSIPIAGYFKTCLNMDAMLIGFGRDDDQIHSPNEKYDLECFHKGIRSWVRLLEKLTSAA